MLLQAETEPDDLNEDEVEATAPSLYPDLDAGGGGDDDDADRPGDEDFEDEPLLPARHEDQSTTPPAETSSAKASPVASSTPRLYPSAPSPSDHRKSDDDTASAKSTEL